MIPLTTQEQYEELWFGRATHTVGPGPYLVWFSAKWCRPCQQMDKALLEAAASRAGIPFYYCDETVNKYTPGYCDVRAFPTFMIFRPGAVVGTLTSSNTTVVARWIQNGGR